MRSRTGTTVLNVFALHAIALSLAVAWQAWIQRAPHLYVTAVIAFTFKGLIIPAALHRIVVRLGIHRSVETVGDAYRVCCAGSPPGLALRSSEGPAT